MEKRIYTIWTGNRAECYLNKGMTEAEIEDKLKNAFHETFNKYDIGDIVLFVVE